MKKVIERLKRVDTCLESVSDDTDNITYAEMLDEARGDIWEAIKELQAPRWETPEQYEKRTGEKWPDNGAVYAMYEANDDIRIWYGESYEYAQHKEKTNCPKPICIICATEAGAPPDVREPEE